VNEEQLYFRMRQFSPAAVTPAMIDAFDFDIEVRLLVGVQHYEGDHNHYKETHGVALMSKFKLIFMKQCNFEEELSCKPIDQKDNFTSVFCALNIDLEEGVGLRDRDL